LPAGASIAFGVRGETLLARLSNRNGHGELHGDLEDETVAALRRRAARHGVSMEEEARRILTREAAAPERLGDLAVRLFSPAYGEPPLDLPERALHEPLDFVE
jgi:hypothetical protein